MQPTFTKLTLSGLCIAAMGLVLLRVFDPATSGIFPPCPVHYLTGWYCPGCGSLRAIHALLHGNLHRAWGMNPLTIALLPFIVYGLLSELLVGLRGRGLPQPRLSSSAIYALGCVVVLFGVIRNLPMHPFSLLAPGAMLGF
jgi:Protein of unknown function (DUF2752)